MMEAIHKLTKILKQNNLSKKIIEEMQRTILMDSETIMQKILAGLVQTNL